MHFSCSLLNREGLNSGRHVKAHHALQQMLAGLYSPHRRLARGMGLKLLGALHAITAAGPLDARLQLNAVQSVAEGTCYPHGRLARGMLRG